MRTQGGKPGQLAAMVVFALSCFGLLLFLWLSFGGSIPLKPKGYRVVMAFEEATTLASQADVRVAGVSVGKVRSIEPDPRGGRTLATVEIERRYAPLHEDAKAMLRQKTLLGETYVELRLGSPKAPSIPEGGRLDDARVEPTVELDEVLEVFPPETRDDFRRFQANQAATIDGRGQDLNAALGAIAGFADDGSDLFEVLGRRQEALGQLVSQTGSVFEALTRDENRLRAFIVDTAQWFRSTADVKEDLATSIEIFPTFLRESRQTLARVERFSVDTRPLIEDLGPVARDLQPTLANLRAASPDIQTAFRSVPTLVGASRTGLPQLNRVLDGIDPVLRATTPFMAQLVPVLEFLQYNSSIVANFIATPGWALNGRASTQNPNSTGHILPQMIVAGSQTIVGPKRTESNRGNAYLRPDSLSLTSFQQGFEVPLPAWDCDNTGGEHGPRPGTGPIGASPGCKVQEPFTFDGRTTKFPQVLEADFSAAARK